MEVYEEKAWRALERERHRQLSRANRRIVPPRVRERAKRLGRTAHDGASGVPGFVQAEDLVSEVFKAAGDVGAKLAAESLWQKRIVSKYRRAGHQVDAIGDIQSLPLRAIDEVKPSFDVAYIAAGATSGAAAGFVMSGAEIAALIGGVAGGAVGGVAGGAGAAPGAGVGAAPGAAVVVSAMAADTAAVLFATARVIFHTAAYYGYDVDRPEERLRALGVLNFATARGISAKNASYVEVEKLAGLLVRNATWKQLDQNAVTKIVRRVFELLGMRITKAKLATALPFVGIAFGATLNARTLLLTADAADMLYRQQFLCDKYDLPFPGGSETPAPSDNDDVTIAIDEIIEAQIDDEADDEDIRAA